MTNEQIAAFILNVSHNDYDYYIGNIVKDLRRLSLDGKVNKDTLLNTIDLLRSEVENKVK